MESMTERLLNLIASKGIKSVDLAKATSVNTSTISRILKGDQIPRADTLYKLAQFFDVTMEFLLTGKDTSIKNCDSAIFTAQESRLITYYQKMGLADQEDILLIAEMKANKGKNKKDPQKLSLSIETDSMVN